MSIPSQFGPPPQKRPGGNRTLLVVLLAVGLATMLCCGGGICGGLIFFYSRSTATLAQVKASIQKQVDPLIDPSSPQDWMVTQQLTRAYTTSLDAVAADKQVIERLGDPIESINEPSALFRRERTGTLSHEDETIEFDIKGPKGTAVVRAVCAAATGPQFSYPWSRAKEITVTFTDGSEIDVPPPAEKTAAGPE